MRLFFWASYTFGLLWLLVFVLQGGRYVRRSLTWRSPSPSAEEDRLPWPPAALLVPLTGRDQQTRSCLVSLLTQNYPDYTVVFITADLNDPATDLVREVLREHPRGRHVVSGPAVSCSQKNHNLLAGLKVLGRTPEVLVFCDANHVAPRHFLQELVRPLVMGEALMTTGFHRIVPGDFRLPTLGMLVTVLIIHLCHGHAGLVQPWGGATAIRRSVFEQYQIPRLWGITVVDDVALARRLKQHRIRVKPVAAACLDTPLAGQTLSGWLTWLTRQFLYVKYFMPGTWLATVFLAYFLVVPPLLALGALLGGALGLTSWGFTLAGGVYLLLLLGLAMGFRILAPYPIPWDRWLPAVTLAWLVFNWSYLKTWCTRTLTWRGITYQVMWGGIVRKVHRP